MTETKTTEEVIAEDPKATVEAAPDKEAITKEGMAVFGQLVGNQRTIQQLQANINELLNVIVWAAMHPMHGVKDMVKVQERLRRYLPYVQVNSLLSDAAFLMTTEFINVKKNPTDPDELIPNPLFISDAMVKTLPALDKLRLPLKEIMDEARKQMERQKAASDAEDKLKPAPASPAPTNLPAEGAVKVTPPEANTPPKGASVETTPLIE